MPQLILFPMKKLVILSFVILLVIAACNKSKIICGVDDPATELPWLAEIIVLAETDTTGNYHGTIYLEYYNSSPVFFTDMAMGSGGVIGYWFNCDGNNFSIDDETEFLTFVNGMKLNKIIYSNFILNN